MLHHLNLFIIQLYLHLRVVHDVGSGFPWGWGIPHVVLPILSQQQNGNDDHHKDSKSWIPKL